MRRFAGIKASDNASGAPDAEAARDGAPDEIDDYDSDVPASTPVDHAVIVLALPRCGCRCGRH